VRRTGVLAVERDVGEGALAADAGVVDQEVDAGANPRLDRVQLRRVAHVGDDDVDLHAVGGLELGGQLLEAITPAGDHHEVRTVGRELLGEGPADAARCAGDEGERPAGHDRRC
jgi:hypothetical protein